MLSEKIAATCHGYSIPVGVACAGQWRLLLGVVLPYSVVSACKQNINFTKFFRGTMASFSSAKYL